MHGGSEKLLSILLLLLLYFLVSLAFPSSSSFILNVIFFFVLSLPKEAPRICYSSFVLVHSYRFLTSFVSDEQNVMNEAE